MNMNIIYKILSRARQPRAKLVYIALVLLLAVMILFSRRPASFHNPQFWAEDGKVWYANAYNLGQFESLFLPQDGYFQTLSRITASGALLFDLSHAPRIFMIAAIIIQLLPVLLIVSGRLNNLIPSSSAKLFVILLYLALPNSAEVFGNLTNAQWYLSLSAVLVLIAAIPVSRFWKFFDLSCVALSGLSGPFSIFLFPISFLRWRRTRSPWSLKLMLVVAATAILELSAIIFLSHNSRAHYLPQFQPSLLLGILNRQVFLGLLLGSKGFLWLQTHFVFSRVVFNLTAVLGIFLTAYALVKSTFELRLFIIFAGLILAAGLLSPTLTDTSKPVWETLYNSSAGIRYWLIPMCAFLAILVWGVTKRNPVVVRSLSGILLASMIFGISFDWRHWELGDLNFPAAVINFRNAPAGRKVLFPLNPPGWSKEPWMELTKR